MFKTLRLTTIFGLCGKLFGTDDIEGSVVLSIDNIHAVTVNTPTITSQGWLAQPLPRPPKMLSNISTGPENKIKNFYIIHKKKKTKS